MKEEVLDQLLYDGKTVRDLLKEIHDNVKEEDNQIKETVSKLLESFSNGGEEVNISDLMAFVAPVIKDYIDLSIKNKKHLIDLVKIIQQLFTETKNNTEDDGLIDPRFLGLLEDRKRTTNKIESRIKNDTDNRTGKIRPEA